MLGQRGVFDVLRLRLFPLITKELGIHFNSWLPVFLHLLFFLSVFVSGPTIYAPFSSLVTLILFGVVFGTASASPDFKTAVISLFFNAVSGYILSIYSSFATLTSMKIFTDTKSSDEHIFEGTLFRAENFRGIFNFRYVGSYILFFIFFSASSTLVFIVKNYLLSLL
ncbi:MAG: hypothetical protein IJ323_02690 [Clostridia bacterium]|nr:hypothetical protein [Clostridia bacterium]